MGKVYILGAGFSVEGGLPTLANFFREVDDKKSKTDLNGGGVPTEGNAFERILKLKDRKDGEGNPLNMESAFTAIRNSSSALDDLAQECGGLKALEKDFLYTVCRTFHLCWCDSRASSRSLYRRFLEAARREQATLITFNYDLILDNLAFDMGWQMDYGFAFDRGNTINFEENHPKLQEHGVRLLKMHGSQNWFKCNSCGKEHAKIDFRDTWMSNRGSSVVQRRELPAMPQEDDGLPYRATIGQQGQAGRRAVAGRLGRCPT